MNELIRLGTVGNVGQRGTRGRALWGLAYEIKHYDAYGGTMLVRERSKVVQVLPHCYVLFRLHLAWPNHRVRESMVIRLSADGNVETGFIDVAVYDAESEDTLHCMMPREPYAAETKSCQR